MRTYYQVTYEFNYMCQKCGVKTHMKYRVPSYGTTVTLTCKNCEKPILKIYRGEYGFINCCTYYNVFDIHRNQQILQGAKASEFEGWAIDHDGERTEEQIEC